MAPIYNPGQLLPPLRWSVGIRSKLMLPLLLAFAGVALSLHFYWMPRILEQGRENFLDEQRNALETLAPDLMRHLLSHDLAAIHATLNVQMDTRHREWRYLQVDNADDRRIFPLFAAEKAQEKTEFTLTLDYPLLLSGSLIGHIHLITSWEGAYRQRLRSVQDLEWFLLATFAAAFLLGLILQNWLVRVPLITLQQAAERIASGDFAVILPPGKSDEVGQLTHAFERMRTSLLQTGEALHGALAEVRKAEARQRATLESMADGLVILDPQGRILETNPAMRRLLGLGVAELKDCDFQTLMVDDGAEKPGMEQIAAKLLHEEMPLWHGEVTLSHGAGYSFPALVTLTPMTLDGARFFTALVHDMSDIRRAQQALVLAREDAERANQAKSEFLATMSHEIRTPMNGVLGLVQLLEDTALDEQQQAYVRLISQSGQTLLAIINDILDFSKIEAGKFQLESAPFSLVAAAETVILLLDAQARDKGLTLSWSHDAECSRLLLGDAVRFRQILFNLLGNALKFTAAGQVTLTLACQPAPTGGMDVLVQVGDTGIGISAIDQQRLFQAFTQAGAGGRYGGTGLGLVICRRLALLMGGDISVDSQLGQGSQFRVRLHFLLADAMTSDPVPSVPAPRLTHGLPGEQLGAFPGREPRILLAEDVRVNQLVAQSMLRRLGCKVDLAENGQEAIARFSRDTFDLVLMDVRMPETDGMEATREIRRLEALRSPGARLPIIALTADALEERREQCLDSGMDDFLTKPFTRAALLQVLVRWLGNEPGR